MDARYTLVGLASLLLHSASAQPPHSSSVDQRGAGGYCPPTYTVGPTDGDFIESVTFGSINNVSGDNAGVGFTDYINGGPGLTGRFIVGNVYMLTVVAGSYAPAGTNFEGFAVWIDYDQNGSYDPVENVSTWTTNEAYQSHTTNFNIAFDAKTGYTRMRVRTAYNYSTLDPCAEYSYGECEDYMVLIEDGSVCIPLIPYGTSDGDEITNVVMGGSVFSFFTPNPYPYVNGLHEGRQLTMGAEYDLDVTIGSYAPEYVGAWIDWNGDSDFDDTGESLGVVQLLGPFQTTTFIVTVPFTRIGYARLRVRSAFNAPGMTACSDVGFGETEDYTVSVRAPGMPCLPLVNSGQYGFGITAFNLQGIDYNIDNSAQWPHYSFHNTNAHRFMQGLFSYASLVSGSEPSVQYDLRMDVNGDGDVDDAGELLWNGSSTSPYENLVVEYTIPANCPPGQHILRWRGYYDAWAPPSSCSDIPFGEIEDVLIVVEENGGYCLPWIGWWTTDGDFIDGLQLNTIATAPNGGAFGPAYTDNRSITTDLVRGQPNTAFVFGGSYWPDAYDILIDYNQDGVLDEATESLGASLSTQPYDWITFNFTVPMTALLGPTLLRVRCSYGTAGVGPCDDAGFGETEDYTVNITTTTGVPSHGAPQWRLIVDEQVQSLRLAGTGIGGRAFEVLDASGRIALSGTLRGDQDEIPAGTLRTGAYVMRIPHDRGAWSQRFVWTTH